MSGREGSEGGQTAREPPELSWEPLATPPGTADWPAVAGAARSKLCDWWTVVKWEETGERKGGMEA